MIGVYIGDGESIARFEAFADDDLTAAMARYHELTGTTPPADAQPTLDNEPWNDADRWMRRAIALRSAGRFDEWAACFDEDVVWVSHRSLTAASYRGRAEVSAAYTDQPVSMFAETLGVRGDSLVLQRHRWIYRDQQFEFEFLLVTRWSADGLLTKAAVYDLADLRAAFEKLDEWHIDDLSPIEAAHARSMRAFAAALSNKDLERAVRALSPIATLHTDRPLSWGNLDYDGIVASQASITRVDGDVVFAFERVDLPGPSVGVGLTRHQLIDAHGSVMTSTWVACHRTDAASGLIARVENFEPEFAGQARAVADRWAAETAADRMVNAAVIAGGLTNALARYGEPGDVLCLLAEDFTSTLTDGTTVTLDDLRNGAVDP
jgi:hypothetical protein